MVFGKVMAEASERIEKYFKTVNDEVLKCYDIANAVKAKGFDPDSKVKIPLAKNMAERVEGLIASVAPQILGTGVAARIQELEKEFGAQNWRVALVIAEEVAKEKFCKFKSKEEAMEIGIRTGFCYVTVGVVSSPLEGFIGIKLRDRKDGKGQYMALVYGGPIRSAGGTGASVSVLISDYVRMKMGLQTYDASEKEIKRAYAELCDYNDRVTNLQYFPSEEEIEFLMKHLPVQLDGDPSEKYDVSNYKDLSRRNSNRISNGFCLITAECLCLKAPKVWKQLNIWGKEMGMEQWMFMENFVALQKEIKARGAKVGKSKGDLVKIKPDTSYIRDLVGGRPVFTHPMRNGGFRLRYGRGRVSGFSADSLHPATMVVTDDFLAVGTQMKTERPGKATTVQVCDEIDGPIVKLKNGDVLYLDSYEEAKRVNKDVHEIIYLGDILINYGDFLDRAHKLIPPGFVEEWWVHYFREAVTGKSGFEKFIPVLDKPLKNSVSFEDAKMLSETLGIPLHPKYIFYWNSISSEDFLKLYNVLKVSSFENGKMVVSDFSVKRFLELVGCPHKCVADEYYVIEDARALVYNLGNFQRDPIGETPLDMVNSVCKVLIKDKLGYFIGARMGRPEKAKMRKMQGSPHGLFPIGEEGGRLKCFQSALEAGKVTAEFPVFDCACGNRTIYGVCEKCGARTKRKYFCFGCKDWIENEECEEHGRIRYFSKREIDIKHYFYKALEVIGNRQYPPLIKGVQGLMSVEKVPEHLVKGIFRAKHNIHVNKDGTVRYDMSELPVTHFKPLEVGTSVSRLKELGYTHDVYGKDLVNDNQVLELIAQDMILPACPEAPEEGADEILFRVTKFIDDCLEHLYGMDRYYNLEKKGDLVGQLIVAMSPHTSAGIVSRIIGFSKVQGMYAHPLLHSIMRRDTDGDEAGAMLLLDCLLNFSRKFLPNTRGVTQDAPLVLTSRLVPSEVDDMVFNMDVVSEYPFEFYQACEEYKNPWDVKVEILEHNLGSEKQYEGLMFTHDTQNFNEGVKVSSYKTLPSMKDKVLGQMEVGRKIRAVDENDAARLVIERHFVPDIKGNLRKFSQQSFRCVKCNEIYRRPPLTGKCDCGGKLVFTIAEGSICKYMDPALDLAQKYNLPAYLQQSLKLLKCRIESVFGKEKEKQEGLGKWF